MLKNNTPQIIIHLISRTHTQHQHYNNDNNLILCFIICGNIGNIFGVFVETSMKKAHSFIIPNRVSEITAT